MYCLVNTCIDVRGYTLGFMYIDGLYVVELTELLVLCTALCTAATGTANTPPELESDWRRPPSRAREQRAGRTPTPTRQSAREHRKV